MAPVATPPTSELLPFDELGHYEIRAHLGRGGMGEVYKAWEPALDRFVAIKVLPDELARHDEFVRRFRAEAAAIARFVHPNIVGIYYVGEDAGRLYFAMRYVDGESLADALARGKKFDVRESLSLVEQVLAGLDAAHRRGFVHRDIKPGNILLDFHERRALLADFGLVRSTIDGLPPRTVTGVVLGTADYMSPEQGMGRPATAVADLYSLGVVLYRLLAGRLPWKVETPAEMIYKHVLEPPPSLRDVAPNVPESLASVVARLLSKRPEDRHQSAAELLSDLRAVRSGRPIPRAAPRDDGPSVAATAVVLTPLDNRLPQLDEAIAGKATVRELQAAIDGFERKRAELRKLAASAAAALAELRAQACELREEARRSEPGGEAGAPAAEARDADRAAWERSARDVDWRADFQERELNSLRAQLARLDRLIGSCRLRISSRQSAPPPERRLDPAPALRTWKRRLLRPVSITWIAVSVVAGTIGVLAAIGLFRGSATHSSAGEAPLPGNISRTEAERPVVSERANTTIGLLDARQPPPRHWPPESRLTKAALRDALSAVPDRIEVELERNGGNLVGALRIFGVRFDPDTAATPEQVRGLTIASGNPAERAAWRSREAEFARLPAFTGLRKLRVQEATIEPSSLKHVSGLAQLDTIELQSVTLLPGGFDRLAEMPRLAELTLIRVPLDARSAAAISRMSALRRLRILESGLADAAAAHLGRLSNLQSLHLQRSSLTDAGLAPLAGLTGLVELDLSRTQVTGAEFPAWPNLERLVLADCPVNSNGLIAISAVSTLRELDLSRTKIDADGVTHLLALEKLEKLSLDRTAITSATAAPLRALPKLRQVTTSR